MKRARDDVTAPPDQKLRRVAPKPTDEYPVDQLAPNIEVKNPIENFAVRPQTVPTPFGLHSPLQYHQIASFQQLQPAVTPPIPQQLSPPTTPFRNNVKFENALEFLDQVKLVFARQPIVYNQFLEIMKDFKTQCIDTPGVIARVSELFKGHKALILGFNNFLPPGFKIECDEQKPVVATVPQPHLIQPLQHHLQQPLLQTNLPQSASSSVLQSQLQAHAQVASQSQQQTQTQLHQQPQSQLQPQLPAQLHAQPALLPTQPQSQQTQTQQTQQQSPAPQQQQQQQTQQAQQQPQTQQTTQQNQQTQAQPQQQQSLDHARNYVKKIKFRFSQQPQIYKSFLEILHTYHKEQLTIKDVYDQVANLFQSHPDLLEEFTQFLPDPGATPSPSPQTVASRNPPTKSRSRTKPPSAKIPSKEVKEVKEQKELKEPKEVKENKDLKEFKETKEIKEPKETKEKEKENIPKENKEKDLKDSTQQAERRINTKRIRKAEEPQKRQEEEKVSNGNQEEFAFFQKFKKRLNNPELYHEFLKCIQLFNVEIISKSELVIMIRDIVGRRNVELFDKFKQYMNISEPTEDHDARKEPRPTHWSEIDLSACKRYGPSYRALPRNYPHPTCTGRTELCQSLLNDALVSVPTGSEEYTFKNTRKNQHEEQLFKCEDERYDLDLIIELNASTMRALEPIHRKILNGKKDELSKLKIDALGVLHCKSIEKLYGDKGSEIVEGLFSNPIIAVPIILKRLKQKDMEWKKARRECNEIWRETTEKHYHKSLDHQSFYFRQAEKRNLAPKVLLSEIKQKYLERLKAPKKEPWHLLYEIWDQDILDNIIQVLTFACEKNQIDIDKVDNFLHNFVSTFYQTKPEGDDDDKLTVEESENLSQSKDGRVELAEIGSKENDLDEESAKDVKYKQGEDVHRRTSSKIKSTTRSERNTRLFFGNTTFYVFFRLHQILYERLVKAKALANEKTHANQKLGKNATNGSNKSTKDKYQVFLDTLFMLISGELEQQKYEEECKQLFGMSAYYLYTLDKLIFHISKQLQTLLSCETCAKLLALYSYEDPRNYYSNAVDVLGDERCFRFEYDPASVHFTIQWLDPSLQAVVESSNKLHYLDNNYSDVGEIDVRKHQVFLPRNKKNISEQLIDNLEVYNALEGRLCLNTHRIFYIENTEDYIYRRGSLSRARKFSVSARRREKYEKFTQVSS